MMACHSTPVAARATADAVLQGETVVSWGSVEVNAARELAFEVLTDYDRMVEFLPGMIESTVVSRSANGAVVDQVAEEGFLFFRQRVSLRAEIGETPPSRITLRALAGSFRHLEGTYSVSHQGGQTLIEYRGRFVPDFELPAVFGLYAVQHSLRRHLEAIADEIERRTAPAPERKEVKG
jgi:ribosome-associated toxin RatA of RatAB toxin-antitoxin module